MKEQAEAVQRMQGLYRGAQKRAITLADLARVSLFSPWHSYRLFKQWTGLTPSDYIRRLRLSTSALKLRDGSAASPMWLTSMGSAAWTDISGRFCGNSAAIRGSTRLIRFPCTVHPLWSQVQGNQKGAEDGGES